MKFKLAMCLMAFLGLAACETPAGGPPPSERYEIGAQRRAEIPARMLGAVNRLRQSTGLRPLILVPALSRSAVSHAKDMSKQNRPWHFGSNGSSPLQRVATAGYAAVFLGELISETYETELETVAVWTTDPATRAILLNPNATQLGVGFFQERSGKLWWTLVTGCHCGHISEIR